MPQLSKPQRMFLRAIKISLKQPFETMDPDASMYGGMNNQSLEREKNC